MKRSIELALEVNICTMDERYEKQLNFDSQVKKSLL